MIVVIVIIKSDRIFLTIHCVPVGIDADDHICCVI